MMTCIYDVNQVFSGIYEFSVEPVYNHNLIVNTHQRTRRDRQHDQPRTNPVDKTVEAFACRDCHCTLCEWCGFLAISCAVLTISCISCNPSPVLRYGENLYRAKILFSGVTEQEMARSAVQSWYNEEPLYNYKFELGAYSGAAKRASASAHLCT